jgi:hypothetical protein
MHPRKYLDLIDFHYATTHAFPDTFAGEALVVETSGCGWGCCTNMAWVELTRGQYTKLKADYPELSSTEALVSALGDLPLI